MCGVKHVAWVGCSIVDRPYMPVTAPHPSVPSKPTPTLTPHLQHPNKTPNPNTGRSWWASTRRWSAGSGSGRPRRWRRRSWTRASRRSSWSGSKRWGLVFSFIYVFLCVMGIMWIKGVCVGGGVVWDDEIKQKSNAGPALFDSRTTPPTLSKQQILTPGDVRGHLQLPGDGVPQGAGGGGRRGGGLRGGGGGACVRVCIYMWVGG